MVSCAVRGSVRAEQLKGGRARGGEPGRAGRAAWPERGPRVACPGGGRGRVE